MMVRGVKDAALYARVRADATLRFQAKTSVYRSAWIVREYKKRGGEYEYEYEYETAAKGGLGQWFLEKWVDVNTPGRPCGRPSSREVRGQKYPLCRPTVVVSIDTPLTADEIGPRRVTAANRRKQILRHMGSVRF